MVTFVEASHWYWNVLGHRNELHGEAWPALTFRRRSISLRRQMVSNDKHSKVLSQNRKILCPSVLTSYEFLREGLCSYKVTWFSLSTVSEELLLRRFFPLAAILTPVVALL